MMARLIVALSLACSACAPQVAWAGEPMPSVGEQTGAAETEVTVYQRAVEDVEKDNVHTETTVTKPKDSGKSAVSKVIEDLPKTGDFANMPCALCLSASGAALVGIGLVVARDKRGDKDAEGDGR